MTYAQHDPSGYVGGQPASSIPYATPAPRTGVQVWASAALLGGGLGLIGLGGCFLIGVLIIVSNGFTVVRPPLPLESWLLMILLYVLAFACFGGAIWLIALGVRGLVAAWRR